jgi:hypothetical protein
MIINLDKIFTDLGIVGGNINAKNYYDFYYGIQWNDGDITYNQYDFFKKTGISRFDFFKPYGGEREFYRSIEKTGTTGQIDETIYDFRTFYEKAATFLPSPDWLLRYGVWNDGGSWQDQKVWID